MPASRRTRRQFLEHSTGAAAAAALAPYFFSGPQAAFAQVPGSKNDRPLFAAIGLGGRGTRIADDARRFGDLVAVCDVDQQRAGRANEKFGGKCELYSDYRRLMEREDVEAVIIGTPDHWHTAIALAAMQAGKDVYCEKPLTLTVAEGQLLSKAVRETGRVFQVGTQQRSDERFRTACELVRNGRVGKLQRITVTLPPSTATGGPFKTEPVPEGLDWDLWLGQAPAVEYCKERCHHSFRWWYEYSGGIMTDWGAHHMDIAHWGLGAEDSGPLTIDGKAELPNIPNGYNTPKYLTVLFEYPGDVQVVVNIGDNGVLFEGDRGRVYVNRGRITGTPYEELAENPLPEDGLRLYKSDDHIGNFFGCVKSRQQPVSDVFSHHRSLSACHLANISIRLGRKLRWNAEKESFVGDDEAQAMLSRTQREGYRFFES